MRIQWKLFYSLKDEPRKQRSHRSSQVSRKGSAKQKRGGEKGSFFLSFLETGVAHTLGACSLHINIQRWSEWFKRIGCGQSSKTIQDILEVWERDSNETIGYKRLEKNNWLLYGYKVLSVQ